MTIKPIPPEDYDKSHKTLRSQEWLDQEAKKINEQGLKKDYAFKYLWAMRDCYTTPLMVLAAINKTYGDK